MSYVKDILLPDENIIYFGRVSAVVYMPGLMLCVLGLAIAKYLPGSLKQSSVFYHAKRMLRGVMDMSDVPGVLAILCFVIGIVLILRAMATALTTELAVTDRRVIVKFGITNIVATEIDRRKIAGVVIEQTPLGRMWNYGRIIMRGYAGNIAPLPPLAKPYDFQRAVNERIRL